MDNNCESVAELSSKKSGSDSPSTPPPQGHILRGKKEGSPITTITESIDPTAIHQYSLTQPQTPLNANKESTPLNWGSGEWSRLIKEISHGDEGASTETTEKVPTPCKRSDPAPTDTESASDGSSSGGVKIDEHPFIKLLEQRNDEPGHEPRDTQVASTYIETTYDSETDQSVIHNSDAMTNKEELLSPAPIFSSSAQTVLRGLIRDAHRGMMYFTLPHAAFSGEDLRHGLEYAFGMLQVATVRLAILATLLDDMANMPADSLREWIAQVDRLDPQTCYEPRMLVVFECLSTGEVQLALAELVQSRLIVEHEAERLKQQLVRRADGSAKVESPVSLWDDDQLITDGVVTLIMVLAIGTLYLFIR
ncbi:hypothetical protein WHR41_07119 [Cladosporium halotolerans]|uniref:Uncharacterized protein n=1 Tax=Cladosporium halotolerans TaxID=1052096 RepID=A0AB34KJH2_9PEZI